MSYIEAGYCKREEYDAGRENPATELIVEEFYVVMFALRSKNPQTQAAKIPAQVKHLENNGSGARKASLLLLNAELEPLTQKRATIDAGFWVDVKSQLTKIDQSPIEESYFRQYGDAIEDDFSQWLVGAEVDQLQAIAA